MQEIIEILPLTASQKSMLQGLFVYPDSYCNFEFQHFLCTGDIDETAFYRAWQTVCRNHPILNSKIVWSGQSDVMQAFCNRDAKITVWHIEDKQELANVVEKLKADRVDIQDFVFETNIIFEKGRAHLLISSHHMIYDGWSLGLILNEFIHQYQRIRSNAQPVISNQYFEVYRQYIQYQKNVPVSAAAEFFKTYLEGYEHPGHDVHSFNIAFHDKKTYRFSLSPLDGDLLRRLSGKMQVTPAEIFISIWGTILLQRYRTDDIVFGVVFSGRTIPVHGIHELVGALINILPIRIRRGSLMEIIQRVHHDMIELSAYQNIPIHRILSETDLPFFSFDSVALFQNYPIGTLNQNGYTNLSIELQQAQSYSDNFILFEVKNSNHPLSIELRYDRARFSHNDISDMARQVKTTCFRLADINQTDSSENESTVMEKYE